jgi:hypothetical protein
MNTETLTKQITTAFADTVYPGDNNLTIGQLDYEEYNGEHESAEIARDFVGKNWSQVSDELMIKHVDGALAFFTDAAFAYYLPAYMIVVLRNPEKADIIVDTLINMLAEDAKHHSGLLSLEQNECVAVFLDYCKKLYE